MAIIRTTNNPQMLAWAREEVGYSVEEAADALGISPEKLQAAEAGDHQLTLSQLRAAAEKYDFPFGYFYLSKPPREKTYEPIPDYRVEPGLVGTEHYRLKLEIKKAKDWRLEYLALASDLDIDITEFHSVPKNIKGSQAQYARNRLRIDDSEISNLSFQNAYMYWKTKIENDGVLVYESQYIPNASGVIGAAIFYSQCPIILIKRGGTSNSRKLFTLLHEYAHLLLGYSAINDVRSLTIEQEINKQSDEVEALCNRLAADILVPPEKIVSSEYDGMLPIEMMGHLAEKFKVTYSTAAVCLRRFNLITDDELSNLLAQRRAERDKKKELSKGDVKIPRENIMRLDMGRPMFEVVLTAYSRGIIDIYDASKILNLRVSKIDKLIAGAA